MADDLRGSKILITGGSSGIGRRIAIESSKQGAQVCVIGRSVPKLNEVRSRLHGSGHHGVAFDLEDLARIPKLVGEIEAEFGPLSAIIHSAGLLKALPLSQTSNPDILQLARVNLLAPIILTRESLRPLMRDPGCAVVFLGSVSSISGQAGLSVYSAVKSGLLGFTRAMAQEWGHAGHRFNTILAGLVDSEMTQELSKKVGSRSWEHLTKKHTLGTGSPANVADMALFLVSPRASWITGGQFVVDGGFSA